MIDRLFRWWAKQFHNKAWQDCVKEWHTFWSGFAIGFTFQSYGFPLTSQAFAELEGEEHYLHTGRCAGRATFIMLVAALIVWICKSWISCLG